MSPVLINVVYIISTVCFIFGMKQLSSPATARQGNFISGIGMLIAAVAVLLSSGLDYKWILIGIAIGTVIGLASAYLVQMTAMPELVALFNGFGGLASLMLGWSVYQYTPELNTFAAVTVFLSVLIGGWTFTGSLIAWLKLSEMIKGLGKPILFPGQNIVNGLLLLGMIGCGIVYSMNPAASYSIFLAIVAISLVYGVLFVIPIGGADMPVVISLLNSFSGLAACAAGFVVQNNILIVAGSLVGASGIILTMIMCKAMNRSINNVLFSGFGSSTASAGSSAEQGEAKPIDVQSTYLMMEAANSVVFIPGYGLAVAQAQHVLRELGELLEANGTDVSYAIHPVAGRMPGHMNVLLAEANVPYDQLIEMDEINPQMETIDIAVVVGANDTVNPAAIEDENSSIYGMPVVEAFKARNVIVLKRSMSAGFAGIQNPLFFKDNTRMLFGDAKATVSSLVAEFKG